MRRSLFWLAAWLAIGASACATFRPPQPVGPDTAKACADWRWIGISRRDAQCPEIPGWTVQPLFPQVSPARQKSEDFCTRKDFEEEDYCKEKASENVPDLEVIRALSRFCVYEVAHSWLAYPKIPPPKSAELVRLDPDCASQSTSATIDLNVKSPESASHLLLTELDMPVGPMRIPNPYSVRLAFLDTEPTHGGIPEEQGNSPHGYALANIGRHLVCSGEAGESCTARITTRLALPILEFNAKSRKLTRRDEKRGGYIGLQSDLAEAIRSEVDAWQGDRQVGKAERHLVLNLSLAWDGGLFGGLDEEQIAAMRAGTQAVYRALQYAAGFDALVLAAAGNQKGEPCDNFGPLLPAAWEAGGPSEKSCQKLPRVPLVYAVGGVGADNRPLVNARPGGLPRRVAYAENAVVTCRDPSRHTAMLTGSSVATTIVSSIAADVWATFPTLSSKQVMEILDASGEELEMQADFWFPPSVPPGSEPPQVHKLSLCSALRQACVYTGSDFCRTKLKCASPSESLARRERAVHGTWVADSCQPWLHPQPEIPPCMSCGPP